MSKIYYESAFELKNKILESIANGGSFLEGFEDGALSGAISGAIGGAALVNLSKEQHR